MSSFNSAFASARKAGKKSFTWNGKKYHTRVKGESEKSGSSPKKSKTPKARPSTAAPKGATRRGDRTGSAKGGGGKTTGSSSRKASRSPEQGPKKDSGGLMSWWKSKVKANSKPSAGSRGRGRG